MIYPFKSVENYPQMLNQLAIYIFIESIIIQFFFLKTDIFKSLNNFINQEITISSNSIPILFVLIAFVFAFISRQLPLHDKISDLLGIRKKYDINNILIPMCKKLNITLNESVKLKIRINRNKLMQDTFYIYASSTKERCQIDHHNVIMALTSFTGFWITIEALSLTLLSIVIALLTKEIVLIVTFGLISVFILIFTKSILNKCKKHTSKEIEEILSNQQWVNSIKQKFNAL